MVLTQPWPRVAGLAATLNAAGHEVATLGFQKIINRVGEAQIRRQLCRLVNADWIIPVSPSAVDALAAYFEIEPCLVTARVALIGPGSLERWREVIEPTQFVSKVFDPLIPRSMRYDALSLMCEPEFAAIAGQRVIILAGSQRRAPWADQLLARGARTEVIAAYQVESITPSSDEALQLIAWLGDHRDRTANEIRSGASSATPLPRTGASGAPVMLASSVAIAQACDTWIRQSLPPEWQVALEQCCWLANHQNVALALQAAGWRRVLTILPGERGLLDALESLQ